MPSVGLLRPAVVGPCVLGVMLLVVGGAAAGDVATDARTRGGSSSTCTFATAADPGGEALIGGMVLADRGGDGALDPAEGDTPVAGAPVVLTGTSACGCPIEERTSTGPDGRYAFPVPAGTYRVVAPQPPGFDDGPDVPGSGSTVDGNDAFLVEVPAGGTSDGNSFAELPRSGLGGSAFDDADGDGARTGTERGIADLQVPHRLPFVAVLSREGARRSRGCRGMAGRFARSSASARNARRDAARSGRLVRSSPGSRRSDGCSWHPRARAGTRGPVCADVIVVMLAP